MPDDNNGIRGQSQSRPTSSMDLELAPNDATNRNTIQNMEISELKNQITHQDLEIQRLREIVSRLADENDWLSGEKERLFYESIQIGQDRFDLQMENRRLKIANSRLSIMNSQDNGYLPREEAPRFHDSWEKLSSDLANILCAVRPMSVPTFSISMHVLYMRILKAWDFGKNRDKLMDIINGEHKNKWLCFERIFSHSIREAVMDCGESGKCDKHYICFQVKGVEAHPAEPNLLCRYY